MSDGRERGEEMLAVLKEWSQMLLLVCGIVIGVWIIWKRRERVGQNALWEAILTGVFFTACSFGAALLFADFESLLRGGSTAGGAVSTYGVYFLAALAVFVCAKLTRQNARGYLDLFALYAIPSLFLMRCNCILSGCCTGKNIFGTQIHWPTRESELVFFVVFFLVLLRLERKNEVPGQLFPILMVSYGCFRFINEWFRTGDELVWKLHLAHIWSIICIGIGLSIWLELKSRAARKAVRGNGHRRN